MDKNLNGLYWLNSWETNKQYNIEVGLNNGKLIKGCLIKNEFPDLTRLPDREFF